MAADGHALTNLALVPYAERHGRDVIQLIGEVFREYGMTFEPDGFDADLRDIPGQYVARGGAFALLLDGDRVVGTVGAVPGDGRACEIKRLYLHRDHRGRGHGRALMDWILGWAAHAGFRTAVAWSDTRLTTAHALYRRLGFTPIGQRQLADADRSREYGFERRLGAPDAAGQ